MSRIELLQGTLDMLILRTLQWGAQHGHGISVAIRASSADVLCVDHGSLYPALHRLREQGLLAAEWKMTENKREAWGWAVLDRIVRDAKFAVRLLRKSPAFALTAIGVLALGIGATTAIFSVVRAVLLRPLGFREPARLVMVWERKPGGGTN